MSLSQSQKQGLFQLIRNRIDDIPRQIIWDLIIDELDKNPPLSKEIRLRNLAVSLVD